MTAQQVYDAIGEILKLHPDAKILLYGGTLYDNNELLSVFYNEADNTIYL